MPQILNFRVEMLEQQMEALSTLPDRVTSLESQILQFRAETRTEFSAVRDEMRRGDEETRRYMRLLHEEVMARIALLDERWNGTPKEKPEGG
jgi:hypothetical protein